jgi:hypothetical protein
MRRPFPAPWCPVCEVPAVLHGDSRAIYHGTDYGPVWRCQNAPRCDYRVGAHRATGEPLGGLADAALRLARKDAHATFDGWWKHAGLKRGQAYRELARRLDVEVAHIAWMDAAQCRRVVALFRTRPEVPDVPDVPDIPGGDV